MKAWEIAILVLIVVDICGGYGAFKYGQHQGFAQGYRAGYKIGNSNGVSDTKLADGLSQSVFNNNSLQTCLDGVDKWYDSNRANVTTIYQQNALDTEKQQNVQECQLRYPTH